jgi:L-ascorbate oxidase
VTAAGPLIVEDAGAPPYKYDDERVLFFTDYFNKTDHEIEKDLTGTPFVWSGEANALLLNGVGISDTVKQGRNECSLPILDVDFDKTYRLRFIGATALSMVSFGIENHTDMNVIGADGHYTKPHPVDYMQVTSGQRFDVLFKTKSAEEVAEMPTWYMQFETKDRPSISTNFGILRYPNAKTTKSRKARDSGGQNGPSNSNNGNNNNGHHSGDPNKSGHGKDIPSTKPLQLTNNTAYFLEYALEPLTPNDFPSASEVTRRIHITNQQLMNSTVIWQMDGLNWTEHAPENQPPYLVDIYRNRPSAMPDYAAALANGGWDPKTLTWPVKLGEVLEIVLENTGSDDPGNRGGIDFHPFHIHGGHYYDCGSGAGVYNAAENEKKLAGYNPVLRDTTNLYRYADKTGVGNTDGWRVWRLRVQDAGVSPLSFPTFWAGGF